MQKRKDITFYIMLYPLRFHKDARRKAESIWCARENGKALDMLEDAFAKKPIPDPSCKTGVIESNIELARKLGITGTPTLIFSDGRMVGSYLTAEKIIEMVDRK